MARPLGETGGDGPSLWALLADEGELIRAEREAEQMGAELCRVIYFTPSSDKNSYISMMDMTDVCRAGEWANGLARMTADSSLWRKDVVAGMEFGFLYGCEFYFWFYPTLLFYIFLQALEEESPPGALLLSPRLPLHLRILLPAWARRCGIRLTWFGRRGDMRLGGSIWEVSKALLFRPLMGLLRGTFRRLFPGGRIFPSGVLMVAQYSRADVETVLPLFRYFVDSSPLRPVSIVSASERAESYIKAQGIRAPNLEEELSFGDILSLFTLAVRFLGRWRFMLQRVWRDIGFGGDIAEVMAQCSPFAFPRNFASLLRLVVIYGGFLTRVSPRILLLADDAHPRGRALTCWARELGIPSINLQNGAVGGEYGFIPLSADIFSAWGKAARRWMVERGTPEDRVVVCGSPRMEGLAEGLGKIKPVDESKISTVLLLTSPYTPTEVVRVLELVGKAVADMPHLTLLVKPHPSEDGALHQRVLGSIEGLTGRFQLLSSHHPLPQALERCQVVVTFNSGVGIEALISGRYMVMVNLTVLPEMIPYVECGSALLAKDKDELTSALSMIIEDAGVRERLFSSRRRFYDYYLASLTGESVESVAELCEGMVKEKVGG